MTPKTRNLMLHSLLSLALLTLMVTPRAYAEGEALLEAHIPFAFHVENTTLPAGDYLVRSLVSSDTQEMEIATRDGSHRVLFLTEAVNKDDAAPASSLVFNEYGNQKFLAQLWTAGDTVGEKVVRSRSEARQAKMGAKPTLKHVTAHPAAQHRS